MIVKIGPRKYRLESKKIDPRTGRHKNLGTFESRKEASRHEAQVEYFKRQ